MRPQAKLRSGTTTSGKSSSTERPPTLASLLAHRPVRQQAGSDAQDVPDDDVLDISGVVRLLRVGRNKVYDLVARNEIPHRRLGKQIRFSRAAIMRWLDPWSSQGAKERQ